MFTKKKCIQCQAGIPTWHDSEIKSFKKLKDESWKVSDSRPLISEFNFSEYPKAIKFTNQIAELAEDEGHHPYIHINFKTVKVILFTHKIDGLHENDFLMASKIDKLFSQQI